MTRALHLILVVAAFVVAAVLYPRMPVQIPIHWNFHGAIDGYAPKTWGAWLMPLRDQFDWKPRPRVSNSFILRGASLETLHVLLLALR